MTALRVTMNNHVAIDYSLLSPIAQATSVSDGQTFVTQAGTMSAWYRYCYTSHCYPARECDGRYQLIDRVSGMTSQATLIGGGLATNDRRISERGAPQLRAR